MASSGTKSAHAIKHALQQRLLQVDMTCGKLLEGLLVIGQTLSFGKSDQGLQQGGAFVFEGDKLLFQHYDPSTGAHVDLDDLLQAAVIQ